MGLATFDIGDLIHITATFTNLSGIATDPTTVTLEVKDPAGTRTIYTNATTPAVTNSAVGAYACDVPVSLSGRWAYRWVGTGAVIAAEEGEFYIQPSKVL